MSTNLPPIYFYISHYDWFIKNMPESADIYQPYIEKELGIISGEICWTLQTYLRLRNDGFPCELTGKMPNKGIILLHRNALPFDFQPKQKLLLVCIKGDKPKRPYAQLHVVQSNYETQNPNELKTVRDSYYYIPLWSQPGLIPRDPKRSDRFETISYFGTGGNLAPELLSPSWSKQLEALDLEWHFKNRYEWNNYSDVDCVVAIRSFKDYNIAVWKPATKLYNAWHAGVPAILTPEPAFQEQRRSELDYIEVTSVNETIAALKRLRDDKELRNAMIENGRIRAQETKPEKLVARWKDFIVNVAVPAYERWCNTSNISQQIWLKRKYLDIKFQGILDKLKSHRK